MWPFIELWCLLRFNCIKLNWIPACRLLIPCILQEDRFGSRERAGSLPDWRILTLLAVAAAILRSAACTVNDPCNKDFDRKASTCAPSVPITSMCICVHLIPNTCICNLNESLKPRWKTSIPALTVFSFTCTRNLKLDQSWLYFQEIRHN